MSTEYALPAAPLRPYVQFYARRRLHVPDPVVVHAVPARGSPMIEFSFGDPIHVRYRGATAEERAPDVVLVGMLTRPHAQLRLQGGVRSFVIMFQPTGLTRLFGVPLRPLTDCAADAALVLGACVTRWREQFAECETFHACAARADALLSGQLARVRDERILGLADHLNALRGTGRIEEVAACFGLTRRTLERRFTEAFGTSPKRYARIVRFQAALDFKARTPGASWASVAHRLAYHDQMHLIHDFRALTGETPTAVLQGLVAHFAEQIAHWRDASRRPGLVVPRFVI
jgi:AraC-like DNA-binding protein